ncbi:MULTISPECIES: NAD(P)H oxidoreductase [unclassified Streptomyces]|uniref:NAD(P)H oxidoreductase n=1 Tax=unclassified Streptomyces TaxID=2593676 RepID=UPI0006B03B2D|nr:MULTISPECIES: NAD(P)H oxidoreductase [unclassified Streptomyces]KOX30820.1 NADPH oxidoreductase [Streptomyces sp. NRRL F-6491]KOX38854.1 NADPH oxidoreductase [Streptomyces sp. NRRL F-6492]
MDRPTARHALLVVAHPRHDSLTAQVAGHLRARIEDAGGTVDLLDLYAERFDPRLTPADEPDSEDREKRYSPEVHAHMDRIAAADEILVVFPVWWFAPPAAVKGWIDRVWNYGFAYGRSRPRLAGKRMRWIGLAGGPAEEYGKTGLGAALDLQLRAGVSEFCGITDASVRLLHGTELSGVPHALRPERARQVMAAAEEALSS